MIHELKYWFQNPLEINRVEWIMDSWVINWD